MFVLRRWVELVPHVFVGAALGACSADDTPSTSRHLRADGELCSAPSDCEGGGCAMSETVSAWICTRPCEASAECGTSGYGQMVCDKDGLCVPPCLYGKSAGSTVCTAAGVYEECADQSAAEFCKSCGCAPFGGGVCASTGCVIPQPDGSGCTVHEECTSGLCDPEMTTCAQPAVVGGQCHFDAQCASHNCSNDGDSSIPGVCRVPLGSPCTNADCNMCIDGWCARSRCTNGVSCAPGWSCLDGIDGVDYCYQHCTASPDCYDGTCQPDGYCY